MGEKTKIFGMSIGAFVAIVLFIFILGGISLTYYRIYAPWRKSIERKVFEETQSYTHAKIQDLAKYHDEWQRTGNLAEKEAIRQVILQRFAEFDESKIRPFKLRQFLVSMRGY